MYPKNKEEADNMIKAVAIRAVHCINNATAICMASSIKYKPCAILPKMLLNTNSNS